MGSVETKELADLHARRIVLLGFGVENQTLGGFLKSKRIRFSVCDRVDDSRTVRLREEWRDAVDEWVLGPEYLETLDRFEVAFRSPGISPLSPQLERARWDGVQISSQTQLFFALCPASILGVTGTKGKGTTVSLVAEMLRGGPFDRVVVGGNIGVPPIGFLDSLRNDDLALLELSSFQLQDLNRSPRIALLLEVTEDHLDYHADVKEYANAKTPILQFQKREDLLIYDADCPRTTSMSKAGRASRFACSIEGPVAGSGAWIQDEDIWWRDDEGSPAVVCGVDEVLLPGRHNLRNVLAATAAAKALGAADETIVEALRQFTGLEHRLENVGSFAGIAYVNDSLGTTPAAAVAAISAFEQPIILIAGGATKRADFSRLAEAIVERPVKGVVLIGDEAHNIESAIRQSGAYSGELVLDCENMQAAVAAARRLATVGDLVLLSPACASFGMFENYRDRGEQFKSAARQHPD